MDIAAPETATSATARQLVILRHARAEAHDPVRDSRRVLSQEGQWQARAVGQALAAEGFVPDLALVSPAERTRGTWETVATTASFDCPVEFPADLYGGYISDLFDQIRLVDDAVINLLVVGHEPTVSAAAAALAGPGSAAAVLSQVRRGLPTAARAHLRYSGLWSNLQPGSAQLTARVKPNL